ncbi:interleukin 21 receptor, tandem duplicate 2 isoform X2 [Colossoma macropomum]|uniref:interleukin 21 receptor, tandem duplicate 2 isoform X2 n=1 Tax=Colossoma macropomum TaxID=42526 RepID=UPI0018642B58|nr:interleukin 21 receptor, tandem duplicate 2 isoform X2 [Colossoma macropomum]
MLLLGILCTVLTLTQLSKARSQAQANALTCVTNYWLTIDCFLKPTAIPNRSETTSYWLEFVLQNKQLVYNCSLTLREDDYNCMFKASKIPYRNSFADYHYFVVSLCYWENGLKKSVLDSKYYPSKHIKPLTPNNLTVSKADRNYTFKWTSGYEKHTLNYVLPFEYKLSYHKEGYPDSALSVHVKGTEFNISEAEFEPGTQYTAKVRNEIYPNSVYDGTSSHWSSAVKWNTSHKEHNLALLPSTAVMVILICLAVAVTFLLLYPVARMKIKDIIWVATPSPNFQSLLQNHQSNIKDWVPKSQVQQIYSEEISTIDAITEITAVERDQEKISSMYVTPQYQTPYVGPSAEVWAPLQKSDTHSVASISCKDLDFLPEESAVEEPMLCLTMFEPIAVEGFLCMDDLELGHEDLEPTETLTVTPKPVCFTQNGFTQNYCTLTNTPIGLIPTFTTGPCNPELVPAANASKEPLYEQTEENSSELVTVTLDSLQLSMED